MSTFLPKLETAIINPLITILALIAFIWFLWGVVEFIMYAGDEEKRAGGRLKIIWGLVGLFIIFGAKAIFSIALNTFGLSAPSV